MARFPGDWPEYVSAAERRQQRERALAEFRKRGATHDPIAIEGRTIARTFWGKAWCDNLERYSDYANRLPRGRSYVRSGAVIDLQITGGRVAALVIGTELYRVHVTIESMRAAQWSALCRDCSGAIESLVALLQGRLPDAVVSRLYARDTGLFPSPRAIDFTCSCPDRASMCKHVAAVLYGIGSRFDDRPELLFLLRGVDQQALVATASAGLSRGAAKPAANRLLEDRDLSALFEIEISAAVPRRPQERGGKPRSGRRMPKR
jgi:uncharacterized Zn finger protein